jgi:hypothetical protein
MREEREAGSAAFVGWEGLGGIETCRRELLEGCL